MTIAEAITNLGSIKPHQYGEDVLIRWLSDLDGLIFEEIMKGRDGAPESFARYTDDMGAELLVPDPYSDIYVKYMAAQVDYYNAETERYTNSMIMFNSAYEAFADWYNRNHMANNPRRITL